MNLQRMVAIVLIVLGVLGLVYGGFSYTKETHEANVGPIHMEVNEKKHVNVPVWAGVAGILVGASLLAIGKRS